MGVRSIDSTLVFSARNRSTSFISYQIKYVKSKNTINLDRITSFKLRVDKYSVSYICLNFYEEKENRKLWHYCL